MQHASVHKNVYIYMQCLLVDPLISLPLHESHLPPSPLPLLSSSLPSSLFLAHSKSGFLNKQRGKKKQKKYNTNTKRAYVETNTSQRLCLNLLPVQTKSNISSESTSRKPPKGLVTTGQYSTPNSLTMWSRKS